MGQFKRITTTTTPPEPLPDGVFDIPDDVMRALIARAKELEVTFGFVPSIPQTVAYCVTHSYAATANAATANAETTKDELGLTKDERAAFESVVGAYMRGHNKIMAIKEVRARTSMGLKDAKDYVEGRTW